MNRKDFLSVIGLTFLLGLFKKEDDFEDRVIFAVDRAKNGEYDGVIDRVDINAELGSDANIEISTDPCGSHYVKILDNFKKENQVVSPIMTLKVVQDGVEVPLRFPKEFKFEGGDT